jgi:oligoendopeptidase F
MNNGSYRKTPWTMALILLMTAGLALAAHQPDPNQDRQDVPGQYKWNATHIFADDAAWEAEFAAFSRDLEKFDGYRGRLDSSAGLLFECLEEAQTALERIYSLDSYTSLFLDVNQADTKAQAMVGRVNALYPAMNQATAFIEPEILTIPQATLDRFLAEHDGLKDYDYYLKDLLRQKTYTLGPDEERIMALSGQARGGYRNLFFALFGVDMKYHDMVNAEGETVALSLPGFVGFRASPVYNVRKQAAREFFGTLKDYENVLASSLDGHVQGHVMVKEARGYDSCLAASLDPDAISPEAYKMLIRTVNENLPRTLHKYVDLRRKVLGLAGPLTFSNLYNSMIADVEMNIPYDEARELLPKALAPLGEEYIGYLNEGLAPGSGWVDIYPNMGKQGGAYSNGTQARNLHPYIKMNFDNSLDNTSTLAHEFGHAIHSIYSRRTQPRVYGDYTSFLAEIASTCNEELLLGYLLKQADDTDTKLMLLNTRLENIRLSIMRQTLFAEFELRFHEHAEAGNPLTAEFLNGLYTELIGTYYGPDFQMEENEEVEWGFISQFWRNFYVFTYATGMTSGISIAEQINDDGRKAADRYINEMLKAGASAPPLEILSRAGVNLETAKPIEDMLDLFAETVEEFDKVWSRKYGKS